MLTSCVNTYINFFIIILEEVDCRLLIPKVMQLKIIQPLQISVVAFCLCSACFLLFFSQMCSYILAWTSSRVIIVDLLVVIITVCLLKYTSYKQTQTQVKAQGISDKYILKALLY